MELTQECDFPVRAVLSLARQPELCDRSSGCQVHDVWCIVGYRLRQWLSEISFSSLAEKFQELPQTIEL